MRHYEIVRFDNRQEDANCFNLAKKYAMKGDLAKTLEWLAMWDNGKENVVAAVLGDRVYDTPPDRLGQGERGMLAANGYNLCYADPALSGGYEAFYLTAKFPEQS